MHRVVSGPEAARRDAHCAWRLKNGTANDAWRDSCGGAPSGAAECAVEDVLVRAWCTLEV